MDSVIDEDAQKIGYISQYEFAYNYKKTSDSDPAKVNLSSILTFVYDFETDELGTFVFDYNKIIEDKAVHLRDIESNSLKIFKVDEYENLKQFSKEVEAKKTAKLLEFKNQGTKKLKTTDALPDTFVGFVPIM